MNHSVKSPILPTVSGFGVRSALAALRKAGVPVGPVMARAGLEEPKYGASVRRVPAAAQGEFLEYAAEALGDDALGLHMAEHADPREAGLLFYVATAAKTLGEALSLFSRYFRLVNESVRFTLTPNGSGVVLAFSFVGVSQHRVKQNTEFWLALIVKAARDVTRTHVLPLRVACPHRRDEQLEEFQRFFGCPVEFMANSGAMELSAEAVALPLATGDPNLLEILRPFCEEAEKLHSHASAPLRIAVESELARLLPHGKAKAETVAAALSLSARTLSDRLAKEGTSFAAVLDQLRQTLALQYLKDSSFTVAQIAWLLGYERPTTFRSAFKRWTGRSPSAFRSDDEPDLEDEESAAG